MKQAVFLTVLLFFCGFNSFSQDSVTPSESLVRRYTTRPFIKNIAEPAARNPTLTLPVWTATADGYTYEMVGTSPFTAQSAATSTTTIRRR